MNSLFTEQRYTRKEVCALFDGIHPSTLWRWEQNGLCFLRGRISESQLTWWLEQAEAAKRLKMKVREFLGLDREERERLLKLDHVTRYGGN